MTKKREDYSEAELRGFHSRLIKAGSADERKSIFKEMDALPQAVGQWFRIMKLAPLGGSEVAGAKGSTEKRKVGRPRKIDILTKKATSAAKPVAQEKKKAGRPKGSKNAKAAVVDSRPQVQKSAARVVQSKSSTGLSKEAKEMLIHLLAKLVD